MDLFNVIHTHPIGTKLKFLENSEVKEINGYEWVNDTCNLIFKDGTKLNMEWIGACKLDKNCLP